MAACVGVEQVSEQPRGLRGRGRGIGDDFEHHAELIGSAEFRDRGECRGPIRLGDRAIVEAGDDPRHCRRRLGCRHREEHAAEAAVVRERAIEHRGEPGVLRFAGRQPDGVVEGVVPLVIDRVQGEFRGPPATERRQRPHAFQPHERGGIVHRWCEQFQGRLEPVGPVADDPGRRRAGPRIGRSQHGLKQTGIDLLRTATVEPLTQPQGLQPQPLEIGVERIQGRQPLRQLGHHGLAATGKEHPLRHVAGIALRRLEMPEQFRRRKLREVDPWQDRASLGGHPPDPSMRAVASLVPEVDLAMLDDRVVPIGDVDGAVGAHLHVDRSECHPLRVDQVRQFFTRETRTMLREAEATDAVGSEVVRDEQALSVVGKMTAVDDLETTEFRAARIHAVENARRARRCLIGRAREAVIDAITTGAVGDERPAPAVECVSPGVHPSACEDVERERVGREPPDPAGVQPTDSAGCLHVAVDVNRLVEVEPGIWAPAEGVDDVVRVFRAEAGEHDPPCVGLAVAIGVGEVEEFRAVGHVDAAVARQHGGRHQETVGEHGVGVGPSVAVAILQDGDRVVGHLARPDLRIHAR